MSASADKGTMIASSLAEVAGDGADAHSGPGHPSQQMKDNGEILMDEAQDLTGPDWGEWVGAPGRRGQGCQ